MKDLRPHSRPTESDTPEVGSSNLCFNKLSNWFKCMLTLNHQCPKDCKIKLSLCLIKKVLQYRKEKRRTRIHSYLPRVHILLPYIPCVLVYTRCPQPNPGLGNWWTHSPRNCNNWLIPKHRSFCSESSYYHCQAEVLAALLYSLLISSCRLKNVWHLARSLCTLTLLQ